MDTDIENFLKTKAIDFVNRKWCAVYLILDEDALDSNEFIILAYFTLSHRCIIPQSDINPSKIKKITGGFVTAPMLHFVLIGQLGKRIELLSDGNYKKANISGKEILDYIFEIVEEANDLIPCRCVLIECSQEAKLQEFYKQNGFKFLQQDEDLYQFYKPI